MIACSCVTTWHGQGWQPLGDLKMATSPEGCTHLLLAACAPRASKMELFDRDGEEEKRGEAIERSRREDDIEGSRSLAASPSPLLCLPALASILIFSTALSGNMSPISRQ